MVIYIIIYLFSFLFYFWSQKIEGFGKFCCYAFGILFPSVLAGLRNLNVGRDISAYVEGVWNGACNSDSILEVAILKVGSDIDLLYLIVNYVISRVTNSIHWYLFTYEVLIMVIMTFIFHRIRTMVTAPYLILIYLFYLYCESLNMMRQSLAIVVSLNAMQFLINNKVKSFYAISIVAYFCHGSAIVTFLLHPILVFLNKYGCKWIYISLLICGGSILFLGSIGYVIDYLASNGLILEKYGHYASQENMHSHKIDLLFLFLLLLSITIRLRKYTSNKGGIYYLLLISFFITLGGEIVEVANRVAYYFVVPAFLLYIIEYGKKAKQMKPVLFLLILVVLRFLYLGITTSIADTIPYESSLLGI